MTERVEYMVVADKDNVHDDLFAEMDKDINSIIDELNGGANA